MRSRLLIAAGAAILAVGGVASVTALSPQKVDQCPGFNSPDNTKIDITGPQFTTLDSSNVDPSVTMGTMICVKYANTNSGVFAWTGSYTAPQEISHYVIYPTNGTTTTAAETTTTAAETTTTAAETTTTAAETTTTAEETTTTAAETTTTIEERTTTIPETTVPVTTVPETPTTLAPPENGPDRDIPIPETTLPPQPRDAPLVPSPRDGTLPTTGTAPWVLGLMALTAIGGGLLIRQIGRQRNWADDELEVASGSITDVGDR